MPAPATETLALPVLGMTCASCQNHVEAALRSTAGVQSAHVDLMANRASVVFDPAITAPASLISAIRAVGYDAVLPQTGTSAPATTREAQTGDIKAFAAIAGGAVAMLLAMPLGTDMGAVDHALMRLAPWLYALPREPLRWFLLILTTLIVVWAGRGIYSSAAVALRHGTTNMNTLVSLGTGVAFLFGLCDHLACTWPSGLL